MGPRWLSAQPLRRALETWSAVTFRSTITVDQCRFLTTPSKLISSARTTRPSWEAGTQLNRSRANVQASKFLMGFHNDRQMVPALKVSGEPLPHRRRLLALPSSPNRAAIGSATRLTDWQPHAASRRPSRSPLPRNAGRRRAAVEPLHQLLSTPQHLPPDSQERTELAATDAALDGLHTQVKLARDS
jgi:hypothetical protein